MSAEKKEVLDPSLERVLKDENGRIICSCRGSAREVLSCLRESNRITLIEGDDEHYEGLEVDGQYNEIEVPYGTVELTVLQQNCATEGIQEVSKGFTEKAKWRRGATLDDFDRDVSSPSPL